MIVGLAFTPFLVKRFGIYQVNRIGMLFSSVFGLVFIVVGYMGNKAAAQFDAHGRAAEHGAVQMYFVFFVGIRGGVCDYQAEEFNL